MFEGFQKFIPKAAAHWGVSKEAEAARICEIFRKVLVELMGEQAELSENVRPAYYRDGEFVVNVSSGAWAQEVMMRKEKIIKEMNERAEKEVVKGLRTQLML